MLSLRCSATCPDANLVRKRLTHKLPGATADVSALTDAYDREVASPRAAAVLAFAFAATALVAAAAGLFSLLSHNVARRQHEFGIRTALGASPTVIRQLVWHDGLTVALSGIGIGMLAGLWLERLLSTFVFEVPISDSWTWTIVGGVLVFTISIASWRPTRAAVTLAPMTLLRDD
jgi:ABC-type antimicrobial peptide transport system permease subunit